MSTPAAPIDDPIDTITELAMRIVGSEVTEARLVELESGSVPFDERLWSALGDAGLLGLELPEPAGAGLGLAASCAVADVIARRTAYVPYLVSSVMAAPVLVGAGTAVPGASAERLAAGSCIATVAVVDPPRRSDDAPGVLAIAEGTGWRLHGTKTCVPFAQVADVALVPAHHADGALSVFVVQLADDGVTVTSLETTSGVPEGTVHLDGCRVTAASIVGAEGGGEAIVRELVRRGAVGASVMTAGLCAAALDLTVAHISERQQFGRRLAGFQAVAHRAADAFVDALAVRLTAWSAVDAVGGGDEADAAVAIARHWAADGGDRVLHAAVHLHGGIGVDRDYPLHRYFVWARHLELAHGGSSEHLVRLGRLLVPGAAS